MTKFVLFLCVSLKSRNSYFGFLPFLVLAVLIATGFQARASDKNRELKNIEIDALAAKNHGLTSLWISRPFSQTDSLS
jgi:high-affinity Fe2+/Pb2+ permease